MLLQQQYVSATTGYCGPAETRERKYILYSTSSKKQVHISSRQMFYNVQEMMAWWRNG